MTEGGDEQELLTRRRLLVGGAASAVSLAVATSSTPAAGFAARGEFATATQAARRARARLLGDGGWCWFTDARAIYHEGRHRRTYAGWITPGGDLVVASVDHATRRVVRAVLHRGLGIDDHNNPALLVGADGHVTAFYSAHPRGRHMYIRRTLRPEDVSAWGPERRLGTNTAGPKGYTYPNALQLRGERRTYLFWRGGDWNPAFARRTASGEWSRARTLLRMPGQRPYVKVSGDGAHTIHIAYTESNPGSFVNSVYYLRYHDDALLRADGSRVARLASLPLEPSRGERVYDARASGVRAWVWDVAAHRDGRPVIVYVLLPDDSGDCTYVYAVWTGTRWEQHPIVAAGGRLGGHYAPGIALDHADPGAVYLSRRSGDRFVVERWRTADRGTTWQHGRLVHPDAAGDAIRPVAIRGGGDLDVMWMQGRYVSFTDYRTEIVAHFAR